MCAYDEDLPPFDSAQRSLRKNTMLNILTEPVIRLDLSGGVRKDANLPEVFAALVSDKVVSFPALRPHQRHAGSPAHAGIDPAPLPAYLLLPGFPRPRGDRPSG